MHWYHIHTSFPRVCALIVWWVVSVGLAEASDQVQVSYISSFFTQLSNVLEVAVPLGVSLAVVAFAWGLLVYVTAGGDEAKKSGRTIIVWGVGAIFLLVSVWGIVGLLRTMTGTVAESGSFSSPGVPK